MIIRTHKLYADDGEQLPYRATPNLGGALKPKYLVIHFTGGSSASSSASWLCNPTAKASAHLVIGRDGSVIQLAPFNKVTWHAGKSEWNGLVGLNQHSIGIELDNAGRVSKRADGKWQNALGVVVPASAVIEGAHKNDGRPSHWHTYAPVQIERTREIASLLMETYGLLDVIGHDDIAPGRKIDPGPAFPMDTFRSLVRGRAETTPELYITTANVNIRIGPGIEHATLTPAPLPKGTKLDILRTEGEWAYVDVQDGTDLEGWVNRRYIKNA